MQMLLFMSSATFFVSVIQAAYFNSQILFIPWGDGNDQLIVKNPEHDISEAGVETPVPGGGPNKGFVDMDDIVYFGSRGPVISRLLTKAAR